MQNYRLVIVGFLMAVAVMLLMGCGRTSDSKTNGNAGGNIAESKGDLTLDALIQAYKNAGVEVDPEEKPLFQLIGAKDGVIFYMNDSKVAIYEFESAKALKDIIESDTASFKDMEVNGKFLLEAHDNKAIEIFKKAK